MRTEVEFVKEDLGGQSRGFRREQMVRFMKLKKHDLQQNWDAFTVYKVTA